MMLLCAIFNFAAYFGPWTTVVRREEGSSGVISWSNRWEYDFHLIFVHSDATDQDFAYRNSDNWYRQCHSNGTWAAVVFGVLALVSAIVGTILLFRHYKKQGDRVLLATLIINIAQFLFYFFSLGFWVLGCHDTVHTYMDTGYATPATTVTNTIRVSWGFGLMLLAWLLNVICTICTAVAYRHKHTVYTSTYIHSGPAAGNVYQAPVQGNQQAYGSADAVPVFAKQDSVSQPGLFESSYTDHGFVKAGLHHRSSVEMQAMPVQGLQQSYSQQPPSYSSPQYTMSGHTQSGYDTQGQNQGYYQDQSQHQSQGQAYQQSQQNQGVVYSAHDQPSIAQYGNGSQYQPSEYGQSQQSIAGDASQQYNNNIASTPQSSMYANELDDLELQMAMNGLQDNY
jgi:hypothetical protein